METIKLIIKGFFIGTAKIIPGVSGAVLAIIFNLYDRGLNSITNFFKKPKENFFFLLKIGLGILLSIIISSKIVLYLLEHYYLFTMLFFIGLIISGIKELYKHLNHPKNNYLYIFLPIIITLLIAIKPFSFSISQNNNPILYFISGLLDAFSTIAPGISGTSFLLILGTYHQIIFVLSNLLNFPYLINNLTIFLSFILGLILGLIIFAKLISYLFQKYYQQTMSFIFGISLVTTFILIVNTLKFESSLTNYLLGLIFFLTGTIISHKLNN